jgi:hypothetical protein
MCQWQTFVIAFMDVMPCSPVEVHQRLDVTYCIHLQDRRYAKQATSKKQAATVYDPEYGGSTFLRNAD